MPLAETMTVDRQFEAVEEAVLHAVRQREQATLREILDSLTDRYSTADLKLALADLLHQGYIELTRDRLLRAAAAAA